MASSRVGVRITLRMPACGGSFPRRWIKGNTNASVLPVPVCAVATRSFPASAGSMAWACTGVNSVKPCFARLFFSKAERGSSENVFMNRLEEENRRADYRSGEKGLRINFQSLHCTTPVLGLPDDGEARRFDTITCRWRFDN